MNKLVKRYRNKYQAEQHELAYTMPRAMFDVAITLARKIGVNVSMHDDEDAHYLVVYYPDHNGEAICGRIFCDGTYEMYGEGFIIYEKDYDEDSRVTNDFHGLYLKTLGVLTLRGFIQKEIHGYEELITDISKVLDVEPSKHPHPVNDSWTWIKQDKMLAHYNQEDTTLTVFEDIKRDTLMVLQESLIKYDWLDVEVEGEGK